MMKATVLVVGDVMLDEFVYGAVNRISPEAATPVLSVTREDRMVGGAGNVARGLKALGANVILCSVIGDDKTGRAVSRQLIDLGIEPRIVTDTTRPTSRKMRLVSEQYSSHLLRADWESTQPLSQGVGNVVCDDALHELPMVDAVVLSDYGKGVLTKPVVRAIIDLARKLDKPVIVDPKGGDFSKYWGCTVITPNHHELGRVANTEEELRDAAMAIAFDAQTNAVLIKRGEAGMTLYDARGAAQHIPGIPVRVRDVSGAGDTVAAVLAMSLACNVTMADAAVLANTAASIVVGKRGTATVTMNEVLAPKGKIASLRDWSLVTDRVSEWRRDALTIGFTNGCFDVLHPGHVKLLREARSKCDRLIVGINSDESVRALKGPTRPVQTADARAEVLAAMSDVDLVVIFNTQTALLSLVDEVRPSVLVVGADYRGKPVVGSRYVLNVHFVDLVPGQSTTQLLCAAGRTGL